MINELFVIPYSTIKELFEQATLTLKLTKNFWKMHVYTIWTCMATLCVVTQLL